METTKIIEFALAYGVSVAATIFLCLGAKPIFEAIGKAIIQVANDLNGYYMQEEEREGDV